MQEFVVGNQYHLSGGLFFSKFLEGNSGIFIYIGKDKFENYVFKGVHTNDTQFVRDSFIEGGYAKVIPVDVPLKSDDLVQGVVYDISGGFFNLNVLRNNYNLFKYTEEGSLFYEFKGIVDNEKQVVSSDTLNAGYAIVKIPPALPGQTKKKKRIKGSKLTPRTVNKAVIKYKNGERYTLKRFNIISLKPSGIVFTKCTTEGFTGYWSETKLPIDDIEHIDVRGVNLEFLLTFEQMHDEIQIIAQGINITTTEFTMEV